MHIWLFLIFHDFKVALNIFVLDVICLWECMLKGRDSLKRELLGKFLNNYTLCQIL